MGAIDCYYTHSSQTAIVQNCVPVETNPDAGTLEAIKLSDLSGILVVSLEHAVAAPYASCKLADAGARVIKVERPEGDFARGYDDFVRGSSAYFVWLNRGKESVCLDLKNPDDLATMRHMLAQADIFIQNMSPGTLDKLGLSLSDLKENNPGLITCSISGYGTKGPAKDQKAYDLLIQAESGLSAINGTEHGPARVGVSVCDIAAGMTAYQAILQALLGRNTTGRGREIEVSLFHAMSDWMNVPYLQYKYGGKKSERLGLRHPTIAPYGVFACRDEKEVLLSIQNEREWARLCNILLGEPDLATRPGWSSNSQRIEQRDVVDTRVAKAFAKLTRSEAISALEEADVAYGRLSNLDDLISHPQHQLISVRTSGGEIELLAPGALVVGEQTTYGAVPDKGEDTSSVRAEFAQQVAEKTAGE